ncbi:MAG: helix-turn-helix transcriptional regulator [Lachnospiraceae bacterium]|nr:helix-turn-helix transcriptional regulator [Lachnospiraceae bacterium]
MDQQKIGQFIQELRKERGLTQKELADAIDISDKTVSKWETGNGLPDISSLLPLCRALGINVNELLSGQRIPPADYSEKAEENMMNLLKENEGTKKQSRKQYITGIVLLAVCLLLLIKTTFSGSPRITLAWYIDLPSLLFLVVPCLALVLVTGLKDGYETILFLKKILVPVCVFETLFELVLVLGSAMDRVEAIGPNLAVCMLTPLYTSILYLIFLLLERKFSARQAP